MSNLETFTPAIIGEPLLSDTLNSGLQLLKEVEFQSYWDQLGSIEYPSLKTESERLVNAINTVDEVLVRLFNVKKI